MGIFSYDSKLMRFLAGLADMMLLNVVYLVCSLPVFTMGAAQAGLYTGLKHLQDPESEGGYIKAFFRGMKTGFWRITAAWSCLLIFALGLVYLLGILVFFQGAGLNAPAWMVIVVLVLVMLLMSTMTLFHARFGCTAFQLVRNALVVSLRFPLRSIAMAFFTWLPIVLMLLLGHVFWRYAMIIALLYYSVSLVVNLSLFKKPEKMLTEIFLESQVPETEE